MKAVPVAVVSLALVAALFAGCGDLPAQEIGGAKASKSASGSKYDNGPRAADTP